MRKFAIACLFACICTTNAQELFDALSFGQLPIQGTARSVSMSNAYGALGGEPSCLANNPAGMGIYRTCEATITLNNNYSQHTTPTSMRSNDRLTISQASYVHTFLSNKKSIISTSLGFAYNRLQTFQRRMNFANSADRSIVHPITAQTNGLAENCLLSDALFSNPQVGWLSALAYGGYLINPMSGNQWTPAALTGGIGNTYKYAESGQTDELNLSIATNIAHWVYLGLSFGIQSTERRIATSYEEHAQVGEERLTLDNNLVYDCSGWNLKIGAIVRPASFLRIGFAYHTPTFYGIKQYNEAKLNTYSVHNTDGEIVDVTQSSGEGYDKYQLRTPSRFLFSTAFILKRKGLISIDYDLTPLHTMRYRDYHTSSNFAIENHHIKTYAANNHTLRIGAEYRPWECFSLRIGGAFTTPAVAKTDCAKTLPANSIRTDMEYMYNSWGHYLSGGVGFRWENWGVDLAYQYYNQQSYFAQYASAPLQKFNNRHHNVVFTTSFRF